MDTEYITVTKCYVFSYDNRVEIPKGLKDEEEIKKLVNKQTSLEEVFEYLHNHFKCPNNMTEKLIRHIARSAIIHDYSVNF